MIINNFPGGYNTLPSVSSSDNNKILSVANGAWTASTITGSDIQVSSTDSTKINEAIDSNSQEISKIKDFPSLGSFSSVAELESILNTALSTMDTYSCYSFRITASANISPFENTFIYHATLHKNVNSNYSYVIFYPNANAYPITGFRLTSSNWTFQRLVLNSELSSAMSKSEETMAIVATGNTHVYIAAGQYVYVKKHTTLADGLYVAISSINANDTLSTSNLSIVPDGGFNSLNGRLKIEEVSDWHNFVPKTGYPNRRYGYSSSSSVLNAPLTGNNTFFGWCEGWSTYYVVHLVVHYANSSQNQCAEYNCYYMNGTWTNWVRVSAYPTKHYSLANNESCEFTMTNYGSVKLTIIGYDDSSSGEILLRRDTSVLRQVNIKSVPTATITMDTDGKVTVTCNYQYGFIVKVEQVSLTTTFS